MNGWVYLQSDVGVWTVGFHMPQGNWIPESDHKTPEEAAKRVSFLNGRIISGAAAGEPQLIDRPLGVTSDVTPVPDASAPTPPPPPPSPNGVRSPAFNVGRATCEIALVEEHDRERVINPFREGTEYAEGWEWWFNHTAPVVEAPKPGSVSLKYGEIKAEKKKFHPGEPVFVLRATDPIAYEIISEYADWAKSNGCSEDYLRGLVAVVKLFEEWQKRFPALVKTKPD